MLESQKQWGFFEKQRNLSGPLSAGEHHCPRWALVRRSDTLQLCFSILNYTLTTLPVPSRPGDPGAGVCISY